MSIEAIQPRVSPNWMGYTPESTTPDRLKALEYQRNFLSRHRDTTEKWTSEITTSRSIATLPQTAFPIEKSLYPKESVISMKGIVKSERSLGTPELLTPVKHMATAAPAAPQNKAIDEASSTIKTGSTEGFFNKVGNFFRRIFGMSVTPAADTTSETHLAGSPKELYLTKSEAEELAKSLANLSLIIQEWKTKSAEQARENQADGNSKDTEILLQLISNVRKKILDAFKNQVGLKENQVLIATGEISKYFDEGKKLQTMHLKNAEEIEARLQTSKILGWVQFGAGAAAAASLVAAIVLALPTGGASMGWAAFATTMLTNLAAVSVPNIIAGGASVVQGVAMGANTYQKSEMNDKSAENVGHKNQREEINEGIDSRRKESTDALNSTNHIQTWIAQFLKIEQDTVKSIARQIDH